MFECYEYILWHVHLQVYWAEHGGWWDGVVTDFNVITGQHWCGSSCSSAPARCWSLIASLL
jgi:hypothetical protein